MDWLEILIPVIIAVVYLFGGNLFGKGNAESQDSAEDSRGESLSDRERQIQDEIRRKIRERQRAGGASTATGKAEPAQSTYDPTQPESQQPHRYDPTQPDGTQRRRVREKVKRSTQDTKQTMSPFPEKPEAEPEPESRRASSPTFLDRMQAQQREIEAMQREAEEIRRKAGTRRGVWRQPAEARTHAYGSRPCSGGLTLREDVIASLKDKDQFKKALLSYEILGTPVGMRQQGKSGPFWEQ